MSIRFPAATPLAVALVVVMLQLEGARGAPLSGADTFATVTALPVLARIGEALAVDPAGSIVAGYVWDRRDLMHAIKWTRQNGSWILNDLPWPPNATSAIARAVNERKDVAGNDFPGTRSRAVLWPATGGVTVLGCGVENGSATVYGISARAQVVVGVFRSGVANVPAMASLWRPGAVCRQSLPPLVPGAGAAAMAVNGDGTIVGGAASLAPNGPSVPVRWKLVSGQWRIEQLDGRQGAVAACNAAGDLAGHVYTAPCASADGCQLASIWYAAGGAAGLGTLGGEDSWVRGLNSRQEAVGGSTNTAKTNTGFYWSPSTGMLQLPFNGQWAAANAVSDLRADGTRLIAGMTSNAAPIVWVMRSP